MNLLRRALLTVSMIVMCSGLVLAPAAVAGTAVATNLGRQLLPAPPDLPGCYPSNEGQVLYSNRAHHWYRCHDWVWHQMG
ncbi:hypothetical protein ACFWY9_03745 [Amycolatopsis sp. NPDC059027]|uniref:hypothetical protein n=1 Tax=unclassified Amycolatopsis TaxID=2618356 RepID=UPI00366CF435